MCRTVIFAAKNDILSPECIQLVRNRYHSVIVFESTSIAGVQQIGSARGCGGPYGEAH